jgi:hypothetical protein
MALAVALAFMADTPASALQAGDVAVVRVNNVDGFESLTLFAVNDIPDASQLKWTDSSWGAVTFDDGTIGGWYQLELGWVPVGQGFIPAGSLIEVPIVESRLSSEDQIFLYTGLDPTSSNVASELNTTFVWAMTWGNPWREDPEGPGVNSRNSFLPSGIQHLGMEVALAAGEHWSYDGPLSGDTRAVLDAISNPANWSRKDSSLTRWDQVEAARPEPVPEPSAAAALASALCLAFALARRKHL